MDSKQQRAYTTQIEKYLEDLVARSTIHLTQAKEHQPQYDMWMNIADCAKTRWESYRYSVEPNDIRLCQGELDSLNCALYMSQLSGRKKTIDVKDQRNPEQIVEEIKTFIQSLGLK